MYTYIIYVCIHLRIVNRYPASGKAVFLKATSLTENTTSSSSKAAHPQQSNTNSNHTLITKSLILVNPGWGSNQVSVDKNIIVNDDVHIQIINIYTYIHIPMTIAIDYSYCLYHCVLFLLLCLGTQPGFGYIRIFWGPAGPTQSRLSTCGRWKLLPLIAMSFGLSRPTGSHRRSLDHPLILVK